MKDTIENLLFDANTLLLNAETYPVDIKNLAYDFRDSQLGILEPKHCIYSLDFIAVNYGVSRIKVLDGVMFMLKYQQAQLRESIN